MGKIRKVTDWEWYLSTKFASREGRSRAFSGEIENVCLDEQRARHAQRTMKIGCVGKQCIAALIGLVFFVKHGVTGSGAKVQRGNPNMDDPADGDTREIYFF